MDDREFILESWRAEAADLFRAGRSAIERADRVLPVVGTVAVAGSIASFANGFPEGFLPLPGLMALALAYVVNSLSDAVAMGLARRRIEEALATELGREVLLYETHVATLRRAGDTPSVMAYVGTAGLLVLGSILAGMVIAIEQTSALGVAVYSIGTLACVVTVLLAVRDERRLWGRANQHYAGIELTDS
jgi:hypothetical protein